MENFKANNFIPPYLSAEKALSPQLATNLIALVEERGEQSSWAYNPYCVELQLANPFSPTQRKNDKKVVEVLPDLFSLGESYMRHGNKFFLNNICELITGHHGFWILKYNEGSHFALHCDWDSGPKGIRPPIVATVCFLLNDDYRGGETTLLTPTGEVMIKREKLSAMMWDGFTQHKIAPITEGVRYALVIHYTGTIK